MSGDLTEVFAEKVLVGGPTAGILLPIQTCLRLTVFTSRFGPRGEDCVNSKVMKLSHRLIDICVVSL